MSTKRLVSRILIYGFALYVAFNIIGFILSMVFQFETSIPWYAGLTWGILEAITIWFFAYWLKPANQKEALTYSISWTALLYLLLLIVTIGNGTTSVVFGQWFTYVILPLMAFAPLVKIKTQR